MIKLGERIKQLWDMGRTGTEAFIELREEQVRKARWEYQRMRFLEDIKTRYPELFTKYSEEDFIKMWDRVFPEGNLI